MENKKRDLFKHKERYLNWKQKFMDSNIPGIKQDNSDIIKRYIFDMEYGRNIGNKSVKGSRSYIRLNNLKQRLIYLAKEFENRYNASLVNLNEDMLSKFFVDMRNGDITRKDGKIYLSVADYVRVFKSFWNWYIKVNKKEGKEIFNITSDLDTSVDKPKWVYLNETQIKEFCEEANSNYRFLITWLFDTAIRSPTEAWNIVVSDFSNDFKELNIREEVSKTFGRRIKLMLSSSLVKSYVEKNKLKPEDYLLKNFDYYSTNRYLQRLAKRIFGEGVSLAGKKYSEITMYDFRHCSCCYWLPRYKSESALKYRFGWKKSDKIHYYSELLGMKDTITEEDLLVDVTKLEMDKKINRTERDNEVLQERVDYLEKKIKEIESLVERANSVL